MDELKIIKSDGIEFEKFYGLQELVKYLYQNKFKEVNDARIPQEDTKFELYLDDDVILSTPYTDERKSYQNLIDQFNNWHTDGEDMWQDWWNEHPRRDHYFIPLFADMHNGENVLIHILNHIADDFNPKQSLQTTQEFLKSLSDNEFKAKHIIFMKSHLTSHRSATADPNRFWHTTYQRIRPESLKLFTKLPTPKVLPVEATRRIQDYLEVIPFNFAPQIQKVLLVKHTHLDNPYTLADITKAKDLKDIEEVKSHHHAEYYFYRRYPPQKLLDEYNEKKKSIMDSVVKSFKSTINNTKDEEKSKKENKVCH